MEYFRLTEHSNKWLAWNTYRVKYTSEAFASEIIAKIHWLYIKVIFFS